MHLSKSHLVAAGIFCAAMMLAAAPSNAAETKSKLSTSEANFVKEAASGGMMEVELGKLAQQKAASEKVKDFGKKMEDDHSKANDELKQLASNKGVDLPSSLNKKHQSKVDKLSKLSGAEFDRQ